MPRSHNSDTTLLDAPSPLQAERNQAEMIEHDQPYGIGPGEMGKPAEDDSEDINEALGRNDDQTWLMPPEIRYPTPPAYMADAIPPDENDPYEGYFNMVPGGGAHDPQNVILETRIELQTAPAGWLRNVSGELIPISTVFKLRRAGSRVIACAGDKEELLGVYPGDEDGASTAMDIVAVQISGAMGITGAEPVTLTDIQE